MSGLPAACCQEHRDSLNNKALLGGSEVVKKLCVCAFFFPYGTSQANVSITAFPANRQSSF